MSIAHHEERTPFLKEKPFSLMAPRLVVVLPAYNEALTIAQSI